MLLPCCVTLARSFTPLDLSSLVWKVGLECYPPTVLLRGLKVVNVLVAQLRPNLVTPQTVSRQGPHGILQARVLEWVAISSSRGSTQLKDAT